MGNRLESLKARLDGLQRARKDVRTAAGAAEKGQRAGEGRQCVAAAEGVVGVDDIAACSLHVLELELRVGEIRRRERQPRTDC